MIGVDHYVHTALPSIPAVAANLTDLRALLTSPGTGNFRPEHCTEIRNPDTSADIGGAIHMAADSASDVLLIYYAGHGLVNSQGRLHLALSSTQRDQVAWTALSFDLLREAVLDSSADARVVILDCCFAGRAFEAMSGETGVDMGEVGIKGTYTIASSDENSASFAPAGNRNTAFTAALLAAGRTPPGKTLDQLFRSVQRDLRRSGYPRPKRRIIDVAGDLVLFGSPRNTRGHRTSSRQTDSSQTMPAVLSPEPLSAPPPTGMLTRGLGGLEVYVTRGIPPGSGMTALRLVSPNIDQYTRPLHIALYRSDDVEGIGAQTTWAGIGNRRITVEQLHLGIDYVAHQNSISGPATVLIVDEFRVGVYRVLWLYELGQRTKK